MNNLEGTFFNPYKKSLCKYPSVTAKEDLYIGFNINNLTF